MYCRGKSKMRTLKIIAVLTLVALAAALLIASAYAYTGVRIGTSANSVSTRRSYSGYRGMMGYGGMMRGYYDSAPAVTAPPQSSTPSTTTPSNPYPIGGLSCRGMMSRIPWISKVTFKEWLKCVVAVVVQNLTMTKKRQSPKLLWFHANTVQRFFLKPCRYVQIAEQKELPEVLAWKPNTKETISKLDQQTFKSIQAIYGRNKGEVKTWTQRKRS
jgi:hypothetical protein